jgi:hypothetical protein
MRVPGLYRCLAWAGAAQRIEQRRGNQRDHGNRDRSREAENLGHHLQQGRADSADHGRSGRAGGSPLNHFARSGAARLMSVVAGRAKRRALGDAYRDHAEVVPWRAAVRAGSWPFRARPGCPLPKADGADASSGWAHMDSTVCRCQECHSRASCWSKARDRARKNLNHHPV